MLTIATKSGALLGKKLPNLIAQPSCIGLHTTGVNHKISPTKSNDTISEAPPANEPVLDYVQDPNSKHRLELERCLKDFQSGVQDAPIVIGGKEYRTGNIKFQTVPFEHEKKLAQFYYADHDLILKSINSALDAQKSWRQVPIHDKIALFEKAANLVSGKYRAQLNAATMLGQAKTIKEAEPDSASELADFFRFNAHYMRLLLNQWQPISPYGHESNSFNFRSLDGFVAAISPFNFTAIGGNLASSPTLMGNGVVWKPSDTAVLSNYLTMKVFQEAGFPDGVINFVPSEGLDFGRVITGSPKLAGINFTGSVATFRWLWSEVGINIKNYGTYPRLVGECGGKNYHFIHKSAHVETVIVQTIRSAFGYGGQKCSACSRLYVPESLWPTIRDQMVTIAKEKLKIGPATDYSVFLSSVIDANAFKRIKNYIDYANARPDEFKLLCGGGTNNQVGHYIEPTIFQTTNPRSRLMLEEIFGPILTVYVYPDNDVDKALEMADDNPMALTGSVFAQDEQFIQHAVEKLKMSAGNFYINDKSTGAFVGQQPFGGARLSGTNDKAGAPYYLMRWCNLQTVKRTKRNLTELV